MRKKHYAFVFCSFVYFFTFSETPEREENEYTSNKYTETADEFGISTADIERSKADYKCTFCFFNSFLFKATDRYEDIFLVCFCCLFVFSLVFLLAIRFNAAGYRKPTE